VRIRQHVNPNLPFFERLQVAPIVVDPARPLELEIGCADAQFLFERAAIEPGRDYVGLEIRDELVAAVNKRAAAARAPVRAVFCHAQRHLPQLLPPGSVDRVYVNFPDPWFKVRHADRRMVDDELAAGIVRALRPGGELMLQTDVWELALAGLSSFEPLDDVLANLAGPWSFWRAGNPYGVRSWREQNAEETGLPIWRLRYVRR
jgi:tRNA (guanine-N7-)-methyltransferase